VDASGCQSPSRRNRDGARRSPWVRQRPTSQHCLQENSEIPTCSVAHSCYNQAMKEAIVRARVDSKLKADAEAVFGTLGINTTEAIRMFLSQVRLRRGLPFIVGIPDNSDMLLPTPMRQEAIDSLYED